MFTLQTDKESISSCSVNDKTIRFIADTNLDTCKCEWKE